jgi:hypothetical protein
MKIIGKTDRGFIVEAERDELYNLIGFYYHASKGAPDLKIGHEIKVAALFRQLQSLANNKDRIETARKALTTVADSLALVDPILTAVEKEED